MPLLDEAYALLGPKVKGKRRSDDGLRTYGHIVVDECQDQPPMALRMIGRRSLNGSMTLVGDIAQATSAQAPSDWSQVTAHLPNGLLARKSGAPRVEELRLSYRIPAPSLALANRVLAAAAPQLAAPEAVRIDGDSPLFVEAAASELPEEVVSVVQQTSAALGGAGVIVAAPMALIDALEQAFETAGLEFGRATAASRNTTGALHPRVTLAPVRLCKGLETDGVIVVEPSQIVDEEEQGLRALYVALTRATKRVAVVFSQQLPEVLAEFHLKQSVRAE